MTTRKVALISGSATGIGRAAAIRFVKEAIAVGVNYSRSQKDAEETLAAVKRHGVPAILCQANVADEQSVKKMISRCREELGGLDVLVNNAGTTHFIDHTNLAGLTDNVWKDIFGVNIMGTFYCIREAMPLLQER